MLFVFVYGYSKEFSQVNTIHLDQDDQLLLPGVLTSFVVAFEQVFEDKLEGIICYRDENGEMVCEGYDEGPRLHQQIPTTTYDPR